jgi:hypothetical protein
MTKAIAHDNITASVDSRVVEIKFPPDTMNKGQREAYEQIAGDKDKVASLSPDECDCDNRDPQGSGSRVPKPDPTTMGAGMLLLTIIGGLVLL